MSWLDNNWCVGIHLSRRHPSFKFIRRKRAMAMITTSHDTWQQAQDKDHTNKITQNLTDNSWAVRYQKQKRWFKQRHSWQFTHTGCQPCDQRFQRQPYLAKGTNTQIFSEQILPDLNRWLLHDDNNRDWQRLEATVKWLMELGLKAGLSRGRVNEGLRSWCVTSARGGSFHSLNFHVHPNPTYTPT